MSLYIELAKRFLQARLPSYDKTVKPMKMTVASTFKCNHRCKICSIWNIYKEAPEKLKEELTRDDFQSIFRQMSDSLIFLDWGGGEPFLREDMCDILQDAASICPHVSSFVITTNGLLTKRIIEYVTILAEKLPHIQIAIGVSLDGDKEMHETIRGLPEAYDHAVDTISQLQALSRRFSNVIVKLSYTLCAYNAGRFRSFHEDVLKPMNLQVGDVGFNLEHSGNLFQTESDGEGTVGHVSEIDFRQGVKEDIEYITEQTRKEKLPLTQRLKSFYWSLFLEKIPAYLENPKKMVIPCKAARNSLYLDPYGNFYPCVVWGYKIGTYKDNIEDMLKSETMQKARSIIDQKKCPVCWNACEVIPSLLTSWRMIGCVFRNIF